MNTTTKRWWRVAVMGAVAGGAIGVARYAGATEEPAVWTPAQSPAPVAVPTAATFPVPQLPKTDPRGPVAPPALPGGEPTGVPPAPKPIDISPVAPPMPLVPPPRDVKPPAPLPTPSPVVPPPPQVAQPAPSAKSAEAVKPPSPVVPDFNLQRPPGGNSVKTDAPATPTLPVGPSLPPVTTPTGLVPPVVGPRGDVPATTVDRPKPADGPLRDSEKFTFPLPTTVPPALTPTPETTHPGDPTVMMIYVKQVAAAAAIGGALAAAPVTPAKALPVPQAKTDPTAADLKKALDDTNTRLAAVESTLKRLTDLIDGRKDEKGYYLPTDKGVVADVKKLNDEIADLKKLLDGVKKTEALRPPSVTPDPLLGKGTVSVVNQYPVEISIVVNDKSYRVAPNAKQDIPVAAGDFSYQLLQNGASPVKSTIKEKEVVTLRIK